MLLGIDLGTGSVKVLLLSPDGTKIAHASRRYAVQSPHPGWAESDPNEWWQAVQGATLEAVGTRGSGIQAIGLSGQMHSLVPCDSAGRAIRNAILWADTRSETQLERFRRLEPELLAPLGNPIVVGMTGPSLLWLQEHEPDLYRRAAFALQPKDWLACQLTGRIQTDPSDASATLLYDLHAEGWHEPLLERMGLRRDLLPEIRASTDIAGTLTPSAARALGLPSGIPVMIGAGDTASAMVGSGLHSSSATQLTVGTGAQLVSLRSNPDVHPQRRTHLYRTALEPRWYAMAAMQNAGLALERVRDWLGLDWQDAYRLAFSVPAGSAGLRFYPYLTGERSPHNNPHLRGAWFGLSLLHDNAHLMRSTFEGVAYAIRDGLEALEANGQARNASPLRIAGGGTLEPAWRQLLADVLDRPLIAVDASDASARGAALLAGLGLGSILQADLEEFAPHGELVATPNEAARKIYAEGYEAFTTSFPVIVQPS